MTQVTPQTTRIIIRPVQYRDLDAVERLYTEGLEMDTISYSVDPDRPLKRLQLRPWHGLLRLLSLMLNPLQYMFCAYLAEQDNKIQGIIRVSPFNRTRSTWRVDQVAVVSQPDEPEPVRVEAGSNIATARPEPRTSLVVKPLLSKVGSQLLRHCFETIWEARTWLLEVNVNDKESLALYRQNGFQPLAHMTYWAISPELLQELAEREPDLPNLLPVSNADAQLLYQLDTAAMPPLVRQVFDRHISDFNVSLFASLIEGFKNWLSHTEVVSGYVFESQRKAAIGYFQIRLCRNGSHPHQGQLTVHPAYTWLYPELLSQMARIVQELPAQALQLASSDYQPEREEYLERIGASPIARTLMMSRSVWHKLRESKPVSLEGLQLSEVLQGLKPARKPVPSRVMLLRNVKRTPHFEAPTEGSSNLHAMKSHEPGKRSAKSLMHLSVSTDVSEPPPEGPCC